MRPPFCPDCGPGHYLRWDVKEGITSEACDRCGYFKRLTPVARAPMVVLSMLVGTCQEDGCGIEFEYRQTRTGKRPPKYCPPCRKGRYQGRGRPRKHTPFGALRKVG